jgi:hypothetical protein
MRISISSKIEIPLPINMKLCSLIILATSPSLVEIRLLGAARYIRETYAVGTFLVSFSSLPHRQAEPNLCDTNRFSRLVV